MSLYDKLVKVIKITLNQQKYMTNYLPMTQKDILTQEILNKVLKREITNVKAWELLSKSTRQIIRIKQNYKTHWTLWIIHKWRWKPSNNKHDSSKYDAILQLRKETYSDYSITMFCEKLEDKHAIKISMPTLRNELITAWMHIVKKRKIKPAFQQRERRENYWELVQYDGSYHKWLEERNGWEELCLLVKIDDATGIINARFDKSEGVIPTFKFWKEDILKNWKPRAIYLDRFATYKINHKNATNDKDLPTQFWRVCNTMWIQLIHANSPQWKWRVEKQNGTLQDRLVKELREANICTMEAANIFLENVFLAQHNARFKKEPRGNANLHIPLSAEEREHIDQIFSQHAPRKLKNDFTIAFKNKYYQLYRNKDGWGPHLNKGDIITVEEHLDGSIHLAKNWKYIVFKELPEKRQRSYKLPMAPANNTHFKEMQDEIDKLQEIDTIKKENEQQKEKQAKFSYFEKTWKEHPYSKRFKFWKQSLNFVPAKVP